MRSVVVVVCGLVWFASSGGAASASAQTVEIVGSRALGMGGAFVAVANDSSATWWNPAGLAAGQFLDMAIARNVVSQDDNLPAFRTGVWSFSLATPPFGISYYRLRLTDAAADPTAQDRADREDGRAGVDVRSVSVSQFGATILHTVLPGVHVGTTVKYLRATPRSAFMSAALGADALLESGDELAGGEANGELDLDVGVLAVFGGVRLGGVVRHLGEPEFERPAPAPADRIGFRLPRQVRVGAAFDADAAGLAPFVASIDADVRTYATASGERRVVALGAEHWLLSRRLGLRGGARINTVGARGEAVTAGASVSLRAGTYLDAHVVAGGDGGEQGWGVAARVSF